MPIVAAVGEPGPFARAIRLTITVVEVDEPDDFCAAVYLPSIGAPVAVLNRAIHGRPHEGSVRRWTFERASGRHGPGYFVCERATVAARPAVHALV